MAVATNISTMSNPTFRFLLAKPIHMLAFGFGSGLMPKAPGTWGSLVVIPLVCVSLIFLNEWQYLGLTVAMALLGVPICGITAHDLKIKDHPGIVWDEFVGMFITFLWVPLSVGTVVAGFVIFRLFDVLKPWPISWVDRKIKGGVGIMIDDVMAGFFALVVMQAGLYWLPAY